MYIEYSYSDLRKKISKPSLIDQNLIINLKDNKLVEVRNDPERIYWRGLCSAVERVHNTRPVDFNAVKLDLDAYGSIVSEGYTVKSELSIAPSRLVTFEVANNELSVGYARPSNSKDLRPESVQRESGATAETLKKVQTLCEACVWNYTVNVVENNSGLSLMFFDKNTRKPINEHKMSAFDYSIKKLIETSCVLSGNLIFVYFDMSTIDKFWMKKFLTELSNCVTVLMVYNSKHELGGRTIYCL